MLKSFINTLLQSIKNPAFIAASAKKKSSKAITYILLLLILIGLFTGIIKSILFNNELTNILEVVDSSSFPDFELANGTFSMDTKEPIILNSDSDLIVIIDVTNTKNLNDLAGYQTGYLLTSTGLTISMKGQSPTYYDLATFKNIAYNKSSLLSQLHFISSIIFFVLPIIFTLLTLFSNFFRSLFLLLLSVILRNAVKSANLKGSTLYQMCLYSMTIGVLLYELFMLIPLFLPLPKLFLSLASYMPFLLFYIPSAIMLSKAIKVYYETTKSEGASISPKDTDK